jgi:hypothetical protein
MKNPKRIYVLRSSVQSYRDFTEILAYDMAFTNKSNDGISICYFAHRQVYLWVECPENFSSKECSLPEILKFQKTEHSDISRGIWVSFGTSVCREENTLLNWNFQDIYSQIYLSVSKISDRNTVIRFVGIYHVIDWNSGKIPMTMDRRPKGIYPLEIFHISLGSTLCTESELKSDWTVVDLPSWVSPNFKRLRRPCLQKKLKIIY